MSSRQDFENERIVEASRRVHYGLLDAKIADHVSQHMREEGELLAKYERAATADGVPDHVRYLVQLVLDDEWRHHRFLTEMMNRLDSDAVLRELPNSMPRLGRPSHSDELRGLTDELLAAERADARDLRQLRRELKPRADSTLFALVVELMELDTAKHTRILEFIRKHLAR